MRDRFTIDLQIVIVLYQCDLEKCSSYQSLLKHKKALDLHYSVLIYNNDNSMVIEHVAGVQIVNANQNNMLSGAYNYAYQKAKTENIKWLLLLDSDSLLTEEYLSVLSSFVKNDINIQYGAAVPILHKNDIQLSPIVYNKKRGPFLFYKMYNPNIKTIKSQCISAFNSCSLLNMTAIERIGGFNNDYPLDMLDHYYYKELCKYNLPIFVFATKVEHDLSLNKKDNEMMSTNRYDNYLAAQKKLANSIGTTARFCLFGRWTMVFCLQILKPQMFAFSKITLKHLMGRK